MNQKTKNAIEEVKEQILPVLHRHGAQRAGIFGSLVHGEAGKGSDVDILIEFPDDREVGLEFFAIISELEDALNRKVDLLTYNEIHPYLKERILKEEIRIL